MKRNHRPRRETKRDLLLVGQ